MAPEASVMSEPTTRARIFARLQQASEQGVNDAKRKSAVTARLAKHSRGLAPARSKTKQAGRTDQFTAEIEKVNATTIRVKSLSDVPGAVAAYLRRHNLELRIRMGADAALGGLDWSRPDKIVRDTGPAGPDDQACLSRAISGVAETGTLILLSGADNPTTLAFMPDHHIVLIEAGTIDGGYEDAFDRLRASPDGLPRAVNMITGPSRTSDIEQKIEFGAHGPKYQHVIIVG
jgi:L-lactate dehydrogenase complex protein LldG